MIKINIVTGREHLDDADIEDAQMMASMSLQTAGITTPEQIQAAYQEFRNPTDALDGTISPNSEWQLAMNEAINFLEESNRGGAIQIEMSPLTVNLIAKPMR